MCRLAGFTLIESLLVLLIISFFYWPVVWMKEAATTLETLYFFDRLEKSILVCHQTAIISNKKTTIVQDYANPRNLNFRLGNELWLEHLTVPDSLQMYYMPGISFAGGTGNANVGKRLSFIWHEKQQRTSYRFTFGKGHFEKVVEAL